MPDVNMAVLVNIIFMAVEMYYNHKSGQSACLHSASKTPSFGIVYYSGAHRDTQVCHLSYKQTGLKLEKRLKGLSVLNRPKPKPEQQLSNS